MKDITEKMIAKIFNDPEALEKRKKYKSVDGTEFKMPDNIYNKLVSMNKSYEVDDLSEIKHEWKKISEHRSLPFDLLVWFGEQMLKQQQNNPRFMDELKKNDSKIKNEYNRVTGEKKGFLGKIGLPKIPTCTLYLNQVKLEKMQSFDSDVMQGAEYEITDIRGNKIRAVYIEPPAVLDAFSNEYLETQETKKRLDETRLDPRPAMVVCSPLNTKEPKLHIIKIQSGGKTIDPLVPIIPGM